MVKYKLSQNGKCVIDTETDTYIPVNATYHREWQMYQEWLAEGNTPLPYMTEEELAHKDIDDARVAFKSSRSAVVESLKVTVGDKVFDGDETSQTRMARAIIVMTDTETVLWILADNTPAQVTKAELTEALRLAVEAQTQAWVQPASNV